jgi:hypothetical protein
MRILLLMLGLVIMAPVGGTQSDPTIFTCTLLNGRLWLKAGELPKSTYLAGFRDALFRVDHSADRTPSPKDMAERWPIGRTNGEMSKALDQFYAEPENSLIPIGKSVGIATMRFNGVEHAEIESYTELLRRVSVGCPEYKH